MLTSEQIGLIIVIAVVLFFLVKIVIPAIRETTQEEKKRQQLLATGTTARATILNMKQLPTNSGSRTVLAELEVQVEPINGSPFSAVLKQSIPVVELPQMPRGATILVRYNPVNTQEITFFGNLGLLSDVVQPGEWSQKEAENLVVNWQILDHDLLRSGNKTPARIVNIEKTGITLYSGAVEVARFTLDVTPPGSSPFRAEAVQFIKQASWQKHQAGGVVIANYDPQRPDKVTLDPIEP